MKKVIVTCSVWLFANSYSNSQTYINLRHNLGDQDVGNSIFVSDSNLIVFNSEVFQSGLNYNFSYSRYDLIGSQLDFRKYGDNYHKYYIFPGSIVQLQNGNYMVSGGTHDTLNTWLNGFVMMLDPNGDSLWSKVYRDINDLVFYDCKPTFDGGYILGGLTYVYSGSGDALLLKLDSIGNVVWERHYGGNLYDDAKAVTQTFDGGYLIAGKKRTSSSWAQGLIIKTDSLGFQIWEKSFGGPFEDSFESCLQSNPDSSFVVAGKYCAYSVSPPFGSNYYKPWLMKLDGTGNIIWNKTYGDSLYSLNIYSAIESNSSSIFGCGSSPDTTTGYQTGLAYRVDINGNLVWNYSYRNILGQFSSNVLRGLTISASDELYLVGNVQPNLPDTGNMDTWILSIDSLGCPNVNCTVGIDENVPNPYHIYPNPCSSRITLEFGDIKSSTRVEIYDIFGNIVISKEIEPYEKSTDVDVSTLQSGIYICSLHTDHGKLVMKILKQPFK